MNREYYKIWIFNGKNTYKFARNQVEALCIGKASGYEFNVEFCMEDATGRSVLPSDNE